MQMQACMARLWGCCFLGANCQEQQTTRVKLGPHPYVTSALENAVSFGVLGSLSFDELIAAGQFLCLLQQRVGHLQKK